MSEAVAERPATIIDRFEAQVAARADRPSLVGPTKTLTFGEVDDLAGRAASTLLELHPGDRSPIAILFEHDVDLIVAFLAVLKVGRPVVVLDPLAPVEVTAAVLVNAGATVLVHDEQHPPPDGLPAEATVVAWSELLGGEPGGRVAVRTDDIAMLAYTSGTTGGAKAATISHRALVHLMDGATEALGIDAEDRLPMLFPVSLAVAAYPMLLPLVNGGALHTFDMRSLGLAPFPAWLAEQKITLIYFSPTVARFLEGATEGGEFPALRTVVLGGERVDDASIEVVRNVFGSHIEVFNGYGTTETGVLTFHRVDPAVRHGAAGVPAGTPIAGMDLVLVDEHDEAVPEGEVGELLVRSRFLFDGYWGQPDLDALVLDEDPDTGVQVYRTGDLGRLADGRLELIGRSDTEVKVRGHRVVPGEVEQAMLALDEVVDVVVEARPNLLGTNELVAWVVATEGSEAEQVRAATAAAVKSHLVPATILTIDELPLLPNGKLDRRSLPEPDDGRPDGVGPYVPCRDDDERMVLDVWEQIFAIRPIGVHDDFEALGGQSLDAARMLVVLESRHGIRLPMSSLLTARTIADLAAEVRALRADEGARTNSITVVTPETGNRPTLYFLHDLHGTAYSLRYLAPLLGDDQPLAGFESPLLDGKPTPFTRLETLALRCITHLRRHQPEGPYLLAGYSFGGVLAFEMARQLVEAGEEVPFLGVFDVGPGYRGRHYHPNRPPQKPTLEVPMAPDGLGVADEAKWYADLARSSPASLADNLLIRTRLDRFTDPIRERRDVRRQGTIHPARRLWYAWRTHWELGRSYRWDDKSYPGPLTLFWADETASTDSTMGWGGVVDGRIDIVRVPIDHETFLQESGVRGIAPALRAELDRVLDAQGATEP
ncbi:MAG TPA: AMP-binding protein [Microthrixaceae bacterium]|nr:AMP-binding protein [Microthrixaceae bacterium]